MDAKWKKRWLVLSWIITAAGAAASFAGLNFVDDPAVLLGGLLLLLIGIISVLLTGDRSRRYLLDLLDCFLGM